MPSNQLFPSHWGQLCLRDEIGLLSTRQPVMSNRESFCKRREKGWSNHSLRCPLPWSPRIHKSSAGIADMRTSIVCFFLCTPYGNGAAHDDRFHLSAWLCDHGLSRHAHGVARSPSAPILLAHLHASRLARAQDLGRDGQVDASHSH